MCKVTPEPTSSTGSTPSLAISYRSAAAITVSRPSTCRQVDGDMAAVVMIEEGDAAGIQRAGQVRRVLEVGAPQGQPDR